MDTLLYIYTKLMLQYKLLIPTIFQKALSSIRSKSLKSELPWGCIQNINIQCYLGAQISLITEAPTYCKTFKLQSLKIHVLLWGKVICLHLTFTTSFSRQSKSYSPATLALRKIWLLVHWSCKVPLHCYTIYNVKKSRNGECQYVCSKPITCCVGEAQITA